MNFFFFAPHDRSGALASLALHKRKERGQALREEVCTRLNEAGEISSADLHRFGQDGYFYLCEEVERSGYRQYLRRHPKDYRSEGISLLPTGERIDHREIRAWLNTEPEDRDARRDDVLRRFESARGLNKVALVAGGLALAGALGGPDSDIAGTLVGIAVGSGAAAACSAHQMRAQLKAANADLFLKKMAC